MPKKCEKRTIKSRACVPLSQTQWWLTLLSQNSVVSLTQFNYGSAVTYVNSTESLSIIHVSTWPWSCIHLHKTVYPCAHGFVSRCTSSCIFVYVLIHHLKQPSWWNWPASVSPFRSNPVTTGNPPLVRSLRTMMKLAVKAFCVSLPLSSIDFLQRIGIVYRITSK